MEKKKEIVSGQVIQMKEDMLEEQRVGIRVLAASFSSDIVSRSYTIIASFSCF